MIKCNRCNCTMELKREVTMDDLGNDPYLLECVCGHWYHIRDDEAKKIMRKTNEIPKYRSRQLP